MGIDRILDWEGPCIDRLETDGEMMIFGQIFEQSCPRRQNTLAEQFYLLVVFY